MLRSALAALALAAACAVPSGASAAANLAISPIGSDSNPCTPAAPCSSFDRAYRLAVPGQIVDVSAGSEFQNMRFPTGWYLRQGAEDVTFRNVKAGIISIGSVRRVTILGGEVGFPRPRS